MDDNKGIESREEDEEGETLLIAVYKVFGGIVKLCCLFVDIELGQGPGRHTLTVVC